MSTRRRRHPPTRPLRADERPKRRDPGPRRLLCRRRGRFVRDHRSRRHIQRGRRQRADSGPDRHVQRAGGQRGDDHPVGTYSGPGASAATLADAGDHARRRGRFVPDHRSRRHIQRGRRQRADFKDPAGTFSGPGASGATIDPVGTYSGPGASAATLADAGYYVGVAGASSQTIDPAGTFSVGGPARRLRTRPARSAGRGPAWRRPIRSEPTTAARGPVLRPWRCRLSCRRHGRFVRDHRSRRHVQRSGGQRGDDRSGRNLQRPGGQFCDLGRRRLLCPWLGGDCRNCGAAGLLRANRRRQFGDGRRSGILSAFLCRDDGVFGSRPTIMGTVAGRTTVGTAPINPFSGVAIGDANLTAADVLTISLTGAGGILMDGASFGGTSTLASLGSGVYTLSGTASAITTELEFASHSRRCRVRPTHP